MVERERNSEENKEALQQKSRGQLGPTEVSVNGKKNICKVSCNMESCFFFLSTKVEIAKN